MKKFIRRLKKNTKLLFQILLFVYTAVALFFILPGEPKFKYEYQKGFPWRHENLIAPFDFAILKSPQELEDEKQEQLQALIPYFVCDTSVASQELDKLLEDLKTGDSIKDAQIIQQITPLTQKLNEFYKVGILQFSPSEYEILKGKNLLKKRIGNRVTTVPIDQIHSEKSAYNELKKIQEVLKEQNAQFPEGILIENYIKANLNYDEETTQKEIATLTANISPTRGMVRQGQRIILQGEIVDAEKFQLLESLKASYEKEKGTGANRYFVSIGKGLLIFTLLALSFIFLLLYRRDILNQLNKLIFVLLLFIFMVFITMLIDSIPSLSIYLVPLAIFPIVIRTFFDSRTAIFTLVILSLLLGFYTPNNYEFVLLQITAGIIAVFSLNRMHRRVHLVLAVLWVFISYVVLFASLNLIHDGTLNLVNMSNAKWFIFSSLLILLVYPLVYIFEKMFGFVSDVTLIELSDTNQPLLRKLAEQAPGTFQHSIQVANLAEEVILRIGGNPFLVRAGALYHDIGKIGRPNFFIENQAAGLNPHDRLNHLKSAEVIINHVVNGVKIAQKHKLPQPIVEFIATHHGTSKAKYFYLKHKEENPDSNIDEQQFAYPGPLPKTKEAAVVMLIDGIEAATRSLPEKTFEKIKDMIDRMIDQKIDDRQLDESELTFRDINIIKETLLQKLINIYHVRIEYPEERKK